MTDFTAMTLDEQAQILKDFMELFRGNNRGHGYGDGHGDGLVFLQEKQKWKYKEGHVGLVHKAAGEWEFRSHLSGVKALGIGPILDDGRCYWGSIDIDDYTLNLADEVRRIKATKLPVVCSRSKSGGLHIEVGFNFAVEAQQVIELLIGWSNILGFGSKAEIFPKQAKLGDRGADYASWIFLPYGPTWGKLLEQVGLNETGGELSLREYVAARKNALISYEQLAGFVVSPQQKADRSSSTKKHRGGKWSEGATDEETIVSTFCDGPPCLWSIAHSKSSDFQHNFLFNCASFFKRKYKDNWEEALRWVNGVILRPRGTEDKFKELVRSVKKEYDYTCRDEPIRSHCNPYACRNMEFGVGNNGKIAGNLGVVKIMSIPIVYVVNMGEHRVRVDAETLVNIRKFRVRCVEVGADFPDVMSQREWDTIVRSNLESATVVEPSALQKTYINEIEMMEAYFRTRVPGAVDAYGQQFLQGKDIENVVLQVRVKIQEERIYFKWHLLQEFLRVRFSARTSDIQKMRNFIEDQGEYHGVAGEKGWFRCSYSLPFKAFPKDILIRLKLSEDEP